MNYLSPFLLNRNWVRCSTRNQTCRSRDVRFSQRGRLVPWPLRRVHPSLFPRLDMMKLSEKLVKRDPSLACKLQLAALFHSKEPIVDFQRNIWTRARARYTDENDRRFKRLPIQKTSNAVNPDPPQLDETVKFLPHRNKE